MNGKPFNQLTRKTFCSERRSHPTEACLHTAAEQHHTNNARHSCSAVQRTYSVDCDCVLSIGLVFSISFSMRWTVWNVFRTFMNSATSRSLCIFWCLYNACTQNTPHNTGYFIKTLKTQPSNKQAIMHIEMCLTFLLVQIIIIIINIIIRWFVVCQLYINKQLRYSKEHSVSVVLSWCTLWHFSGANMLMADQPLLCNWPRKLPNSAK